MSITITDIAIRIANEAYGDHIVQRYYERDGQYGDGLARFIANEIKETTQDLWGQRDPNNQDDVSLALTSASRYMLKASKQLLDVAKALVDAAAEPEEEGKANE